METSCPPFSHLHGLPVEPALDAEPVGVPDGGGGGDDGADRAEGVEGLSLGPLAEGALPVPPAHVVAARVTLARRRREEGSRFENVMVKGNKAEPRLRESRNVKQKHAKYATWPLLDSKKPSTLILECNY